MLLILSLHFVPKIDDIIFNLNDFFQFSNPRELLYEAFYYGNGRFLGNLLAIVFSKAPRLFYFLEFLIIQAFCICAEKLIELKNSRLFFLNAIILQPIFLVNQVASWLCGFINYFIPTLILIVMLLIMKSDKENINGSLKALRALSLMVLGFTAQLYVQHNAIMNIVIIFIVCCIKKHKGKSIFEAVIALLSCIAGAVLLFGYDFYIDKTKTWTYQYIYLPNPEADNPSIALSLGSVREMIKILASNAGVLIFCFLGCAFLHFTINYVVYKIDKRDNKISKKPITYCLIALYYPMSIIAFVLYAIDRMNDIGILAPVCLITGISVIATIYATTKCLSSLKKEQLIAIGAIFLLGVCSFTPFFLYTTTGAFRGCELFYIAFTICVALVIKLGLDEDEYNSFISNKAIASVVAVITIAYIIAYANQLSIYNYKLNNYKTEYYLPRSSHVLVDRDMCWSYADGNIEHEFVNPSEFKY